jgi:hypothetical protein
VNLKLFKLLLNIYGLLRHIHVYVLKLLIMLEISLITVIYKRIGKLWFIFGKKFLRACVYCYSISSDWWISGLTPKEQKKLVSLTICWPNFYSLGNINPKKPHKVCDCLIFASISVQMQRYSLEDFLNGMN